MASSSSSNCNAQPRLSNVKLVADFLSEQVQAHRVKYASKYPAKPVPPLFVGVQGPQGAGKSFLTGLVPEALATPEYKSLKVASLSLDDLYLRHEDQTAFARAHPQNALLKGRGPPGTHDLPLAEEVLGGLARLNEDSNEAMEVLLPDYDKSLFGGEGDRKAEGRRVQGPGDIVIFEGWMTGFRPLPPSELEERHKKASSSHKSIVSASSHPDDLAKRTEPFFADQPLESLRQINEALQDYEPIWDRLQAFIELRPEDSSFVWGWRLEQEHAMKKTNGGKGMTDEQVGAFIARYMPCYELFDRTPAKPPSWQGNGLRLVLNKKRELVRTERF